MMLDGARAGRASSTASRRSDGAFYAPKIDIQIEDALGREWQTATIQVDRLMLPERFDLHYIDENGQQQRPVAIHRAIYGLARAVHRRDHGALRGRVPVLVRARSRRSSSRSPTATSRRPNALAAELRAAGVRSSRSTTLDNRMQNKIRLAQGQKVPYMLVLGDREIEARTASVRKRGASKDDPQETLAWSDLAQRLGDEVRERRVS